MAKKYKVCIVDDSDDSRSAAKSLLREFCENAELAGEAATVSEGLELIRKTRPDVVLLDIEMPDGTGFDLARQLASQPLKIIFISAHQDYALQALRFSAVDYLLKPLDPYELNRALEKAEDQWERETMLQRFNALLDNLSLERKGSKKLVLKTADAIHVVSTADVLRCEANGNYTSFYLKDNKRVVVSKTLKEFEGLSDHGFLRCHQSHLVNTDAILSFLKADGGYLLLNDQSRVPVSTRNRDAVLDALSRL